MTSDTPTRDLLARALSWHDAHVTFDEAVSNIPVDRRGEVPVDAPHSPWQLLEHLRITQADILDFCRNPHYQERKWPDDYWPAAAAPATPAAWSDSVEQFTADRQAVMALARDPLVDLHATIPHGDGQTYLRELLLLIDHSAYHVGQLVLVRRLLGVWT